MNFLKIPCYIRASTLLVCCPVDKWMTGRVHVFWHTCASVWAECAHGLSVN